MERSGVLMTNRAALAADELREKGRCEHCALVLAHCICQSLRELRQEVTGVVGVRFALWMHVAERSRASNTGKLLAQLLPQCDVFLHGVPADVQRFDELTSSLNGRAFVLFPSEDALPLAALREEMWPSSGQEFSSCGGEVREPFLVVLVDGTWDQAKRMHKALKGLPHIALQPIDGESTFTWRKQSLTGRVTTAEAAALLLDGLGQAETGAPCALLSAVQVLERALEQQTHYLKNAPPLPHKRSPKPWNVVVDGVVRRGAPCRHYVRGHCCRGADCLFRHEDGQVETTS